MNNEKKVYEQFKLNNKGKYIVEYLKSTKSTAYYKLICTTHEQLIFPIVNNQNDNLDNRVLFNSITNQYYSSDVLIDICNRGLNNYGGHVRGNTMNGKNIYYVSVYID